jgi:hypothetical protein
LIEISKAILKEFCEWLENEDEEAAQLQKQSQ